MNYHNSQSGHRWIVVNQRTGASRHPHQHTSIESAKTEAARIARSDPGVRVWVLMTVGFCIKKDVEWVNVEDARGGDHLDDEIPF